MKVDLWSVILMKLHIQKGKRMNQIIRNVRDELKQAADDKTKKASKSFSRKSQMPRSQSGSSCQNCQKIFSPSSRVGKRKTSDLCDELFESGYCEEVWWRLTGRVGSAKIFNQMILRFLKRGLKNISATGLNVILCAITLFVHLLNNIRNTLITWKNGLNRKIAGCGAVLPFR